MNLPYQLFTTIYQNAKEWNNMPTRHYFQICFPMPTCSSISNSLKLGFLLNPFTSLLIILAWWLAPMVGDEKSRWMGYHTTNIKMWPQPKKMQTFPFIWIVFRIYLFIGLICISHHKLLVFLSKLHEDFQVPKHSNLYIIGKDGF